MHMANPDKYKKNIIILGQIAFFTFITYLFIVPIYLYAGAIDYDYIMTVFLLHITLIIF